MTSIARFLVLAAMAALVSACAQSPVTLSAQALPGQAIGPRGINTSIGGGKIEEGPYVLLTSVRVYPHDGWTAICGAVKVLARTDISGRIRSGLAYEKSTLTLTPEQGGRAMVLSPKFMPVTYQHSTDGKFGARDIGTPQASCVTTDAPWDSNWDNRKFHSRLSVGIPWERSPGNDGWESKQ